MGSATKGASGSLCAVAVRLGTSHSATELMHRSDSVTDSSTTRVCLRRQRDRAIHLTIEANSAAKRISPPSLPRPTCVVHEVVGYVRYWGRAGRTPAIAVFYPEPTSGVPRSRVSGGANGSRATSRPRLRCPAQIGSEAHHSHPRPLCTLHPDIP